MVKAKSFLKRSLSLLLSMFLIIPLSTITAYSLDFDPNAGAGNSTGGEYVGGGGGIGWSVAKQGYRVTLL